MANSLMVAATAAVFLFIVQQAITEVNSGKRILTPDEQALADEARAEIAQVLERNLIKFFTLVAVDNNGRELFKRQDDDDDDGAVINPTVLPQVAQILGAIFQGGLNISKIVDQSFSLAADTLRVQVHGIFQLLTGQPLSTTTAPTTTAAAAAKTATTAAASSKPRRKRTTTTPKFSDYEDLATEKTTATTKQGSKYALRNRNRTTSPPFPAEFLPDEDGELFRLEEEVISAAIDAEPYVRDKEPRFFLGSVQQLLGGFDNGRLNITQVIRFLPDLFTGARQAFTLLENLGQLAGIELEDDD